MTEKLQEKRLSVKRDIVFKRIFAHKGNEAFLTEFLSSLLNINIKKIEIMHDIHLEKDIEEDKLGIIDVRAIINDDSIINIEIQLRNEFNIIKRSTFYGSKLISEQLKKNDLYNEIKPVIVICILNYNYFPFEEYINDTVMVLSKHRKHEVNTNMKYYYIELPKFRKSNYNKEDVTNQWLTFIDSENSKELDEIMKKNNTIKKAKEELEYLEGDEAFKRKVELREKYERDLASALYNREQKGIKEGIKKGKEEGIKKGKEEGIRQGRYTAQLEIAKAMLEKGISIKDIENITGIKEEELKNT